jgi:hypothetical protein
MLGITRWHVFKVLAAILCIAGLTWLGMAYLIPAPPSQITIATSPEGEHYHVLGTRYKGILAETEIKVALRLTDGAKENLQLLKIRIPVVDHGDAVTRCQCDQLIASTVEEHVGHDEERLRVLLNDGFEGRRKLTCRGNVEDEDLLANRTRRILDFSQVGARD